MRRHSAPVATTTVRARSAAPSDRCTVCTPSWLVSPTMLRDQMNVAPNDHACW